MPTVEAMRDWEVVMRRMEDSGIAEVELVRSPSGAEWGVRVIWLDTGGVEMEVTKHATKEIATDQFWTTV